jgi:hypothetical protein
VVLATGKVAANVFVEDRLIQVRTQTQFCQNSSVILCKKKFYHLPFLPTERGQHLIHYSADENKIVHILNFALL